LHDGPETGSFGVVFHIKLMRHFQFNLRLYQVDLPDTNHQQ
jgi:hypothetical protein